MEIEIVPQPTPEEREALLSVLAERASGPEEPSGYRSPWRRAGLPDAQAVAYWATTPRLNKAGASRA